MITQILSISLILILSYLIGSIPFGFLIGKWFKKIDIREHGSGNIGATNVLRVLGTKLGLLVMLLDILKGVLVVKIALNFQYTMDDWFLLINGFAGIIGHIFTVFLGFKGGKGVATACGVSMALMPLPFVSALFIFILVVSVTRYVSLGSISASIMLAISITVQYLVSQSEYRFNYLYYIAFTYFLAGFIIYKHIPNLKRLIKGTENKLSFKKK